MRKLLATLAGLAFLAAAVLFLTGRRPEEARPGSGPVAAPPPAAEATGRRLHDPSGEHEAGGPPVSAREAAADPIGSRASSGGLFRGRVELPGGAPADPTLRVVLFSGELPPSRIYGAGGALERDPLGKGGPIVGTCPVEPDGAFSFQLPPGTDVAWAVVDGRFLFSTAATPFAPATGAELRLEPRLGACFAGRVTRPSGPGHGAASVLLQADRDQFALMKEDLHWLFRRGAEVGDDGRFELRGVDPLRSYDAEVRAPGLAAAQLDDLRFAPGRVLEVEVALVTGARCLGRVVDGQGDPVPGATVAAVRTILFGFPGGALEETESDAAGRFELARVPPGEALLVARSEGRLESRPITLELADGETREGLELVLERGSTITGEVRWTDGSPAAGADVEVSFDPEAMLGTTALNMARGARGRATTGEDGRFAVEGLGGGPFAVKARAKSLDGRRECFASRTGVRPDEAIELVLHPRTSVTGRVEDPAGDPVERFEVRASTQGAAYFLPGEIHKRSFADPEGRFVFDGLEPGTWSLEARSRGFAPAAPVERTLVPGTEVSELVFVLAPEASAAGRVVDPDGAPVVGARVTLQTERERTIARLAGQLDLPECTTDDEGAFRLGGLPVGEVSLLADHPDFAPSTPLPLELAPGGEATELVLALRAGARLTGEVYDAEGHVAAGARIILQDPGDWESVMGRADARGRFVFEHLRPGSWNVTAIVGSISALGPGDPRADTSGAESPATSAFMENLRFTLVELANGEEEHVVLGAPPEDPVRLSGRVLHAGEGVAGATISFFPEGADDLSAMQLTSSGAEGRYALTLGEPGRYHVQVQLETRVGSMSQENVELLVRVPSTEEHELDLELPTGRIRGRVLDPDGQPAPNTRVTLTTGGGVAMGTFLGGHYAEITTDARGVFVFDFLRAGTYDLAAGGALFGGAFGTASLHGRVVESGLSITEGRSLDDLELRLSEARDIEGRVVDATGHGVAGAAIFVRDAQGRLLERVSLTTSDHDGRFRYRGVPSGTYQLSARKGGEVSPVSGWVSVGEGGAPPVRLTLAPGAMLEVTVSDAQAGKDEPPRVRVELVDDAGRAMHGLFSFQELQRVVSAFDTAVSRFGPLAPGRYTVRATAPDGRGARRALRIAPGESLRKVRLRLR